MKQEITITERANEGVVHRAVMADVFGGLGVHKYKKCWRLSHIRSGWGLGQCRTKKGAIYCRDWLAGVYDWEAVDESGEWPTVEARAFCSQKFANLRAEGRIDYIKGA